VAVGGTPLREAGKATWAVRFLIYYVSTFFKEE